MYKACAGASLLLLLSGLCYADNGNWTVRGGLSSVNPSAGSDNLFLNGADTFDEDLDVDDNIQLGLTVEYHIDQHWGVELLASTPFEHTASGTRDFDGLDLVDVKHLPPTLSAIYHFETESAIKPYVGIGINYTIFFEEDTPSEADAALEAGFGLTGADVEVDPSLGIALQVGADYAIDERWLINASVRWIDLETDVDIDFDDGTRISTELEIDPMVYSLLLGYRL